MLFNIKTTLRILFFCTFSIMLFSTNCDRKNNLNQSKRIEPFFDKKDTFKIKKVTNLDYLPKKDTLKYQLEWRELKCGLWINKNRDIGLQTKRNYPKIKKTIYITVLGRDKDKPLKSTIDTSSFKLLGNYYYKDKNHVYQHYITAGGGWFYILLEADINTFQLLNNVYAKDKNTIFTLREGILEDVDYKTFKIFKSSEIYAQDKKSFFYFKSRIDKKLVKEKTEEEIIKQIRVILDRR